jgi:hypothetical protein
MIIFTTSDYSKTTVWMQKAELNIQGYGWISSSTSTAVHHLCICRLVSGTDVQKLASDHQEIGEALV